MLGARGRSRQASPGATLEEVALQPAFEVCPVAGTMVSIPGGVVVLGTLLWGNISIAAPVFWR